MKKYYITIVANEQDMCGTLRAFAVSRGENDVDITVFDTLADLVQECRNDAESSDRCPLCGSAITQWTSSEFPERLESTCQGCNARFMHTELGLLSILKEE